MAYGHDYCCPECEWRPEFPETFGKYTIGIDESGPPSKQKDMIATEIVECPKDGVKFWMHINDNKLNTYKELYPEKFGKFKIEGKRK